MPQLSDALIDEVRIHLTERWQNDVIYQRYANAPTGNLQQISRGLGRSRALPGT
jgi:hypothetical protein